MAHTTLRAIQSLGVSDPAEASKRMVQPNTTLGIPVQIIPPGGTFPLSWVRGGTTEAADLIARGVAAWVD